VLEKRPYCRADDFYRVCEEWSSNQRVVLKIRLAKVKLHSIHPIDNDGQLHSAAWSCREKIQGINSRKLRGSDSPDSRRRRVYEVVRDTANDPVEPIFGPDRPRVTA